MEPQELQIVSQMLELIAGQTSQAIGKVVAVETCRAKLIQNLTALGFDAGVIGLACVSIAGAYIGGAARGRADIIQ